MPQLVTQIVLVDQDYGLAYGENKVQAVVEYVNGLTRRCFYLDELPPDAVRSYYADYYMTQVINGHIHQFVHNSRWHPLIVDSVSAALDAVGLPEQAALFSEARHFIERDRLQLEAYLAGRYGSPETRPYMDALAKIGGDFYARFAAHPGGRDAGIRQIAVANAAWISSWPNVSWVTEAAFEPRLDALTAVIPDLAERKRRAEEMKKRMMEEASKRMNEALARRQEMIRSLRSPGDAGGGNV